jgi:hypothetical protein
MFFRRLTHLFVPLLVVMFVTTACSTGRSSKLPKDFVPVVSRIHIEAGAEIAGMPMRMPISGATVMVNPRPSFGEFDVLGADIVRSDVGPLLFLQLTPEATRDYHRMTLTNRGRRVVLTLNNAPVATRLIDQPVGNGALFFFLEVPETELPMLVRNINLTSREIQEQRARARR